MLTSAHADNDTRKWEGVPFVMSNTGGFGRQTGLSSQLKLQRQEKQRQKVSAPFSLRLGPVADKLGPTGPAGEGKLQAGAGCINGLQYKSTTRRQCGLLQRGQKHSSFSPTHESPRQKSKQAEGSMPETEPRREARKGRGLKAKRESQKSRWRHGMAGGKSKTPTLRVTGG